MARYDITISLQIKTFEPFEEEKMLILIRNTLLNLQEFRDVIIYDYTTDCEKKPNPFSDVRKQVIDATRET